MDFNSALMLAIFAIHTYLLVKTNAKYLLVLIIAELCMYQFEHLQFHKQLLTAVD
jgi:hypothetical protein